MRQFDLIAHKNSKDQALLVLQSDLTSDLDTVIVAPVIHHKWKFDANTSLTIDSDRHVLISQMAAIQKSQCGETLDNFDHLREDILKAIDLLFCGF